MKGARSKEQPPQLPSSPAFGTFSLVTEVTVALLGLRALDPLGQVRL